MSYSPAIWSHPARFVCQKQPDHPVFFFNPASLQQTVAKFRKGFPGLVSYAVKANDCPLVLEHLISEGITTFDVASVAEMQRVRALCPGATLHYNNPVRSRHEIRQAVEIGCRSWSVDCADEFEKLCAEGVATDTEIAVRLKLPVSGATYDFGEKFGAPPVQVGSLLRRIVAQGYQPALCFHPGTQCAKPAAWAEYIEVCAKIARAVGVFPKRLNVGGGFAVCRGGTTPARAAVFRTIKTSTEAAFGELVPLLLCEPGRALVADAFVLCTRIKAVRGNGDVFLNDGIYGNFGESPSMGTVSRLVVLGPDGRLKKGNAGLRRIFGPTCDSLDQLPEPVMLPETIAEGDYVLFYGMGAYSAATQTGFNGYGNSSLVTVHNLCNPAWD